MSVRDPDADAPSPTDESIEANGQAALREINELDTESADAVVAWILEDQDGDVPSTTDVVECLESADVALAFDGSIGYGYVATSDVDGEYLHFKRITDEEKIQAVADVENREPSDVRITRSRIDETTVREWARLAVETSRLVFVDVEKLDVFDEPSRFHKDAGAGE